MAAKWIQRVEAAIAPTSLEALFANLNFLNLAELHGYCRECGIPYTIHVETGKGLRKSRDNDRKSVVLERVRGYLTTGVAPPPTVFARTVVREAPPPRNLSLDDRLYYGWYDKHDPAILDVLARATGDRYRNGAVARILMRELWGTGTAPTFAEFGRAWLDAEDQGLGIAEGQHPEAAWLTDRAKGTAGDDWKAKRTRIARSTLELLSRVPAPS